jgi:hypothetical protein
MRVLAGAANVFEEVSVMTQISLQEVKGTVPSSSKPGQMHVIKRDVRCGIVWCDCMAWRFSKEDPKTCKHIRQFEVAAVKAA